MAKDRIFKEKCFTASPFGVPDTKGVYAICVVRQTYYPTQLKNLRVVYIGSSSNMRKRLMNMKHPYRRCFSILKNYWVSCFYIECDNCQDVERSLIKKYKPRFNIQYNG